MAETGYGYQLDPMSYTDEQLIQTVRRALEDEQLRSKMKKASERVRKDQRMEMVADQIVNYLDKL